MGKAVRAKRVSRGLKINVSGEWRERCGWVLKRGRSVLVLFFCAALSVVGQPGPDPSPTEAARLQRMIASGSVEEKRTALSEIRNLRSAAASAIAVPALRDANELVRATAVSSVVFLPKADAARSVIPLLSDKSEFVRLEAAFALGTIGDHSATQELVRVMNTDRVFEVRTAAAVGIGGVGDVAAIPSLIAVLRNRPREEDEFLRRSAARSIGQIAQVITTGNPQVVTPQNFLPDKFKDIPAGVSSTATAGAFSTAVDVLINVLRSNSEADDTRREAAFSLGAIGDARAVPALQASSTASDPYLAEISREALMKIEQRSKPTGTDD